MPLQFICHVLPSVATLDLIKHQSTITPNVPSPPPPSPHANICAFWGSMDPMIFLKIMGVLVVPHSLSAFFVYHSGLVARELW
jgi:hypothetical protein